LRQREQRSNAQSDGKSMNDMFHLQKHNHRRCNPQQQQQTTERLLPLEPRIFDAFASLDVQGLRPPWLLSLAVADDGHCCSRDAWGAWLILRTVAG
jgi:hypothetical protein